MVAARCKLLCPPDVQACPKIWSAPRILQTKETIYPSTVVAMRSSVGRNSGDPPPPLARGSSAPAPCSPSHSRNSVSDTLPTVSSISAGTLLPTSVEVRKSKHHPATPLIRQEVPGPPPALPSPHLLPHPRSRDLLLRPPLGAIFKEVWREQGTRGRNGGARYLRKTTCIA